MEKILFENREEAIYKLIDVLPIVSMEEEEWIVIAISSGAVFFADRISKKLENSSLDVLFTEAISAPNNRECIVAMVSESEEIVTNQSLIDSFDINLDYIYGEASRKYEEKILKYIYKYRKGEVILPLEDKNVILVDEGIETGLTMMTSIKTAISMNAKTISIVAPVIPHNLVDVFQSVADEVYFLHKIPNFLYTPCYYRDLPELFFDDIKKILDNNLNFRKEIDGLHCKVRYK